MTIRRASLVLAAILTLFLAWRFVDGFVQSSAIRQTHETATESERGRPAPRAPRHHADVDPSRQVEGVDGEVKCDASVSVTIDCEPADALLEWTVGFYREPTESTDRQLVAERDGSGSGTVQVAVPAGLVGVRVVAEGGYCVEWQVLDVAPGASGLCQVSVIAAGRLRGRVLDDLGNAIAGAQILLAPATELPRERLSPFGDHRGPLSIQVPESVESDADGSFEFPSVDPRRTFECAAVHPAFAVARERGIAVRAAQSMALDLTLASAGRVVGRLLDHGREPIASASLRLAFGVQESPSFIRWHDEGNSVSDSEGRFAFGSLTAGWKKIETVVSAEPGLTVVGHWEAEVTAGEELPLGDLVIPNSQFQARISAPEGVVDSPRIVLHFTADRGSQPGRVAAVVRVPVIPDDDSVVRIRGLPKGVVSSSIHDDAVRADGRHRPRSDFGAHHDGRQTVVEWRLRDLEDGPTPNSVEPEDVRTMNFGFEDRKRSDLVFVWVDGRLTLVGEGHSRGTAVVPIGAQVRIVVTDGDRYAVEQFRVDDDVERTTFPAGDRPGGTLTVRALDDGRGVPHVTIAMHDAGEDSSGGIVGETSGTGELIMRGLPMDVEWRVRALRGRGVTDDMSVVWEHGRATVDLDIGQK